MTPDERLMQTITLLKSIDASLQAILKAILAGNQRGTVTLPGAAVTKAIADDKDLDSKYGDETVKFKPRDWLGADYKDRPMSQCSPDFLDVLAASFEHFATKNEQAGAMTDNGKPKAVFDRRSAARARGWARRLRTRPTVAYATDGDQVLVKDDSPPWEGSEWPQEGF